MYMYVLLRRTLHPPLSRHGPSRITHPCCARPRSLAARHLDDDGHLQWRPPAVARRPHRRSAMT